MPGAIDQRGPGDGSFMADANQEVASMLEEPVTLHRWQGNSGGDAAAGVAATDTWKDIKVKAVVSELEAREINYPNSIYQAGDLKAEFRMRIYGGESNAGDHQSQGRKADEVTYRNRRYRVIGHPNEIRIHSARSHWECRLRQIG